MSTPIDAREYAGHYFVVGDTVRVGSGKVRWRITGFFGPNYSYAALERVDLASSHTSAHLTRLKAVLA